MSKASPSLPYGTLDLLVLRTLAAGARHGYGILLQIHEASNNLLRIEEGSLYPALHRLRTQGLLKEEGGKAGEKRTAQETQCDPNGAAPACGSGAQLGTRGRRRLACAPVRVRGVANDLDTASGQHASLAG